MENKSTRQFFFTIPAGRRMIAKAVASMEKVSHALKNNTVVIIAGTTNSYVAQELLSLTGQLDGFVASEFYRGAMTGANAPKHDMSSVCDIVLEQGVWKKGKSIFDVAADLKAGDMIIKGANAVNPDRTQAGILIGVPSAGTTAAILPACVGRRVELILPIGLEKRILTDVWSIAQTVNASSSAGTRLMPVAGDIVTELEALGLLTGTTAQLVASGGIYGGEGGCLIAVTGTKEQLDAAAALVKEVSGEPPFGA